MNSNELLLMSISDSLPQFNLNLFDHDGYYFLKFGNDPLTTSKIFISEGHIYIHLYLANTKIDMFTCDNIIDEIDSFIRKYVPI